MPISACESGMLRHRLPSDDFIRVVLLERERVFRFWTFVGNLRNIREKCHIHRVNFRSLARKGNYNRTFKRIETNPKALNDNLVTNLAKPLIDFLELEQSKGETHIYLDTEARDSLRELYLKSRIQRARDSKATENLSTHQGQPEVLIPEAGISQIVNIIGKTKAEKIDSVREQAAAWGPARSLGTLRQTMVFSTGNLDAAIMLVGEGPGHQEEKDLEPFTGPAGKKLNDILKAMGLKRDEVYLTNLVKYRPSMPRQTTNNRKPTPQEMAACLPLLLAEIEIIRPQIIVALGATAAEGLLGLSGTVASMREKWHTVSGISTRVTYHPSYLLQSGGSTSAKRALWEDMLATMAKLEMPISAKQESYFLPKM